MNRLPTIHDMNFTPCYSHRIVRSNRTATRTSDAPRLAIWADILRLQRSEDNARSPRLFQPAFPGSIFVAPANERHSFRTVSDADSFWVCTQASPNAPGKAGGKTRGFTSCVVSHNVRKNVKSNKFVTCFRISTR